MLDVYWKSLNSNIVEITEINSFTKKNFGSIMYSRLQILQLFWKYGLDSETTLGRHLVQHVLLTILEQ